MILFAFTPPDSTIKFTGDEMLGDVLTSFGPVFRLLPAKTTMKHRIIKLHRRTEPTPFHCKVFAAEVLTLSSQESSLAANSYRRVFGIAKMNMM